MSGADVGWVHIIRADLDEANLSGEDLSGCKLESMNLRKTIMQIAVLRSASFNWMILKDVDLRGADLRNAKFDATFLQNVNLSGADLRDAELNQTALVNVDLSGANLMGIKYDNLILPMIAGSKLDNAKMSVNMQKDLKKLRSGQT
ncbi:Pentapeptide repeats (8 copies) [uncultured archaeon]|nr:Pentapeptide repeats (8 copies) [uncultured archaeon]